jgi:hypothetical protein
MISMEQTAVNATTIAANTTIPINRPIRLARDSALALSVTFVRGAFRGKMG